MPEQLAPEKVINIKEAEVDLVHLETNGDLSGLEPDSVDSSGSAVSSMQAWIITSVVLGLLVVIAAVWVLSKRSADEKTIVDLELTDSAGKDGETGKEVKLDPEMLTSAGIQTETVTERPAVSKLFVTGAIELNPETTEMATLLVGGRIERVNFGVGDTVQRGAVLAVISSPQLAQMHGKMHEAKTKYELAQRNLTRVQRSENRVAVLQAKAKLDEAEATLKRTKRLIELGAGAGKDIVTAETTYRTAKADFDFQSNIARNFSAR